jgi:hypothetical protein
MTKSRLRLGGAGLSFNTARQILIEETIKLTEQAYVAEKLKESVPKPPKETRKARRAREREEAKAALRAAKEHLKDQP